MLRTLLACLVCSLALGGCANGWPTAKHPLKGTPTAANCVPTTSKIGRNDCVTTTPGSATSGNDADRTQTQVQTGRLATFGKP